MLTNKSYRLRRAIVVALYEYSGAQDLDTVMCHINLLVENATVDMIRVEWENLMTLGLIEAIPGYNRAVAKLSAGTRLKMQQNNGQPPLIEALFGAAAL